MDAKSGIDALAILLAGGTIVAALGTLATAGIIFLASATSAPPESGRCTASAKRTMGFRSDASIAVQLGNARK
jgi:hypothetical protein